MKVFIADDSRVVVERLADLLEEVPGAQLVGQAGDVPEAVRGIQEMKPDAPHSRSANARRQRSRCSPCDSHGLSAPSCSDLHELPLSPVSRGMLDCRREFLP